MFWWSNEESIQHKVTVKKPIKSNDFVNVLGNYLASSNRVRGIWTFLWILVTANSCTVAIFSSSLYLQYSHTRTHWNPTLYIHYSKNQISRIMCLHCVVVNTSTFKSVLPSQIPARRVNAQSTQFFILLTSG